MLITFSKKINTTKDNIYRWGVQFLLARPESLEVCFEMVSK